jgi:hypothetical protein
MSGPDSQPQYIGAAPPVMPSRSSGWAAPRTGASPSRTSARFGDGVLCQRFGLCWTEEGARPTGKGHQPCAGGSSSSRPRGPSEGTLMASDQEERNMTFPNGQFAVHSRSTRTGE